MREAGQLDRKHLVMFLFADFESSPNADNNSVDNKCTFALARHDAETRSLIQAKMEMTGAYIDECAEAVKGQRQLPNAPHVSGVAVKFDDLAKPAGRARKMFLDDVCMATNANRIGNTKHPRVLKDADCHFTFKFPDGQTLSAVNDIGPAGPRRTAPSPTSSRSSAAARSVRARWTASTSH